MKAIADTRRKSEAAALAGQMLGAAITGPTSPLVGEVSLEVTEGDGAAGAEFVAGTPVCRLPPTSSPQGGRSAPPQRLSPAERLTDLETLISILTKAHRPDHDWDLAARDHQIPPPGDWRNWLLLGGRGSGKTRAGAEWVHGLASAGEKSDLRIALVAETLGDAREVMIDGMSGICRIARRRRPEFEVSRRRLVWPNGAIAQIFSSEDPESLRGPQFHYAWCDELPIALCARYATCIFF